MEIDGKEVKIEQFRNDWALALMTKGIVVKLTISRWRATTKLTNDDLGLRFFSDDSSEFMQKYIQLGRQKLLPPNVVADISSIEREARSNLVDFSFDTIWGKFVPYTAFSEWDDENKRIQQEFFRAAMYISDRYVQIVDTVKDEYRVLANDVWSRLYGESNPTASFVESFVNKVVSNIPPKDEIIRSFNYNVTYFAIPLPSFVEGDLKIADDLKRQRVMSTYDDALERETKRRISEEYVSRKRELIDGFLESTVNSMRKYVAELCDAVLISIGKQKKVDGVTKHHVTKLKRMIRKVSCLNFQNDGDIQKLLRDLEDEIDKFKGERDNGIIVEKLKELVETGEKEFSPEDFGAAIGYLEL